MQWIKVEDGYPKTESLLLTTSKKYLIGDWYDGIWRVAGKNRWTESINGGFELLSDLNTGDITHWMPLPEPPHQPKTVWQRSTKSMPDIWITSSDEEHDRGQHLERFNWRRKEI